MTSPGKICRRCVPGGNSMRLMNARRVPLVIHENGWKWCMYIYIIYFLYNIIPVVPARGGAEVALKIYIYYIYKTFLIYRTCMRRAPAKPVRALCETGVLFHMSHLKLHVTLHTWQSSHFTLHSSHCTLHTAPFAVNTSLHTVLLRLHTSHSTLPSPSQYYFVLKIIHFPVLI